LRVRVVSLLVLLLAAMAPPPAWAAGSPVGRWITDDGEGVIAVAPCGAEMCGRIVGMAETRQPDGSAVVDSRGRPQCGLTILVGTSRSDAGVWQGHILDPDDGTTWTCEFWVAPDGFHLRGYLLTPLFGQTRLWHRYYGAVQPDCRLG
jgi:uncharacterized protein (DUF2147 family)